MHKAVAAALVTAGLLAGCGGDDGGATADPAPEATTTTEAAFDPAAFAALVLTPDDLATGDSLDVGWVVGDVSAGVDIELPECVLEETPADATATAESKLVTDNDLKLPSLEEDLGLFPAGGAAAAFEAAGARLNACDPTFVFQGAEAVGQIAPITLALGGDRSAAWRTTVTIAGAAVSITNVHVQQGDYELSLVHVDLGTPDPTLIEGFAAKALAKLA